MNLERWAQLEELFHRAAECDPRERAQLLDEACRDDLALRGEVEALLANEQNASRDMRAAVDGELHNATFTLVGETVSHYRILDGLGGGGMGLVYRAEDLRLGRQVALKFLPEELAQNPVALKRLEQEARAASALNHPNVCTIHEIAEHGGRPFIVMELLEGETLRERVSGQRSGQQRLTLERQIGLAIQISDALAAAHARGIIHRDIKPANIFVTRSGVAKILDFGVAKLSQRLGADEDRRIRPASGELRAPDEIDPLSTAPADDPSLTRTGATLGTAGYMSPEQVRGEALDARTDLFSFGLVLYEMATGRAAFAVATAALMREAILHREPTPARELNPAIPKELAQIIRKALEKDRDQRYPSAAEIRVDLERLGQQVVPTPRARWRILAGGGIALAALAAAIVWLSWQQPAVTEWPDAKLQQLTTNSWEDPISLSTISPDGRHLAYIDGKGMHIKLVGAEDSKFVAPPEGLRAEKIAWELVPSAWFPDNRRFLATSHPATEEQGVEWSTGTSSIWVISVSGGAPVKLRDAAMAWAVSPDGASIGFGSGEGPLGARELWMMRSDGTQARKVVEVDDARSVCCMYFFTGTRFAYIVGDRSGDTLVARDLDGGRLTTLLSPSALRRMGDGALLPDGRLVYHDRCEMQRFGTPCELWIERFDTSSGKLIQGAHRLTSAMGAELGEVSATANGKLVAFQRTTSQQTAYVAEVEPGATGIHNMRHFTLEEGDDAILDWTPDSQTAIIARNRGDHSAVYKQALRSDVAEPIVARIESAAVANALVSADGKWVTVQLWPFPPPKDNAPRGQLWRVPITGGALQKLFSMAPGSGFGCARAPVNLCVIGEPSVDRRQVIVTAFDPTTGLRGGELLRFDRYPNPNEDAAPLAFALSPDGQWLTTSATPSGPLRILSLRGAPARVLPITGLNAKRNVTWTSDGRGLIVGGVANKEAVLMRVDLAGEARVLLRCESAAECFVIPSPDSRMLGVVQTRLQTNVWMLQNF